MKEDDDLTQLSQVDRGEAGSPGSDDLKKRGQDFIFPGEGPQRSAVFESQKNEKRANYQSGGRPKNQLAGEGELDLHPLEKPDSRMAHLPDDQEAQSPEDDQLRHDKVDEDIPPETHQAVAVQGESSVTEPRDGVEEAREKRRGPRMNLEETEEKEDKPGPLDDAGEQKNALYQSPEIARRPGVVAFLHQDPVADRDRPSRSQKDHRGKGHHSQASQLDKEEDDALSGDRKIRGRIDDDEPGDADGRGRGEQGVNKGDPAGSRAKRKPEEKGTQEDCRHEAYGQPLARRE